MKWIGKHPVFSDLMIGSVLLTPPDNQYEYELTLPNNDGSAGQVLTTDGDGVLTWTTVSSGSGTVTSITPAADSGSGTAITTSGTLTFTGGTNVTTSVSGTTVTFASTNTEYSAATSSVLGLLKIEDDTEQSVAANTVTATAGRTYGIQFNSSDQAVVNVPWTDTIYTLPQATATARGGVELFSDTVQSVAGTAVSATASRTYGIQLNSDDQMVVNVPWTDTNTTYTAGNGLDLSGTEFSTDLKSDGGLVIESTELAVDLGASSITGTLAIADGGTGQTTAQAAIDALTAVSSATAGHVLTKDGSGNATFQAAPDTKVTLTGTTVGGLATYASTDNLTINSTGTFNTSPTTSTLKLMSPQDTGDLLTIDVTTHGATTFTTTDDDATAADLTFTPDGDAIFNIGDGGTDSLFKIGVVGGTNHFLEASGESGNYSKLILYEQGGDSTDDFFQIKVEEHGVTTLRAEDASGGQASILTLDTDGLIIFDADRNGTIQFDDGGTQFGQLDAASSLSTFTLFEAAGASSSDFFKIQTSTHGATTILTSDAAGTAADLTLDVDGSITIDSTDGRIDIEDDGAPMARIQNSVGTELTVYGTSSGVGKLLLREDTSNGTNDITIRPPTSITSDRIQALQDKDGTIALTDTARSLVKLKGDDFYLALVSSVNRWYHVAMYGQSISTSSLDGLSIADSTAIRMCSFIATQNCTVHKVSVAWYQTVTADLEWEIVKVPIVNNSTSNVTLATMTATDCDDSYTANTNYMKVFTVSGGNTLTAGQGLAVCVRRTSGSSSILYGWANGEIEITD